MNTMEKPIVIGYKDSLDKVLARGDESFVVISSCVELLRHLEYEADLRYYSGKFKKIIVRHVKDGADWYVLYRKILLIEAPFLFSSFLLYVEIDRPARERFYMPRRKQLKTIVDALQDLNDNKLDELFISQPPRTGKTTLVLFFLVWVAGKNTEQSILYSAYSDVITKAMYDGFIEVLGDSYTYKIKDVFPDLNIASTNSKTETIDLGRVKRYKTLTCRSLYGTLNGACDCNGYLISDDLIGGIEEALNKDRMMGAWSKVVNNLIPRAKMSAKKLWIGTRWSLVDPIGLRLDYLENEESRVRYKVVNIPALDENDESNFDYEYNVGFDSEYYKELRAQFERNNDMASWNAQYAGDPIEREGALFETEDMKYYNGEVTAPVYKKYMAVDVAFGGGDYVSAPIAWETEDGESYIVDWVFDKGDKTITRPLLVDAIMRNEVTDVTFEKNNGGGEYGEWVENELRDRGYRCTIRYAYAPTTKRKEQRIFELSPEIRQFWFRKNGCRSKMYQLAMNNLLSFKLLGKNKNDDAPDSLAQLAMKRNSFIKKRVVVMDRRTLGF